MVTIEQCRAARGLLGWTQQDLADACGLSKTAINNFEKEHSDIKTESLRAIRMAFESLDIEFIGQEGLRKKQDKSEILKGPHVYKDLLDDITWSLKNLQSELLIQNLNSALLNKISIEKYVDFVERLETLSVTRRIMCDENTAQMDHKNSSVRILKPELSRHLPTVFIYGTKVAILPGLGGIIILTDSKEATKIKRQRFENLWTDLQQHTNTESSTKNALTK